MKNSLVINKKNSRSFSDKRNFITNKLLMFLFLTIIIFISQVNQIDANQSKNFNDQSKIYDTKLEQIEETIKSSSVDKFYYIDWLFNYSHFTKHLSGIYVG